MKVQQISTEVSAAINDISELVHDRSISESEKNQRLDLLKASVIAKIDAEENTITFAGKVFLKEIKEIVAAEDWAVLPKPNAIKNTLSEMKTLVVILSSLEQQLMPTMEAIQRLFIEAALKQIQNLSDSELSAVSKQWGAATTQFQRSEEAAALERTSGIITAAVGIGVAVMSLAAKAVVTAYSMNKFNAAKPDKELSDRLTDTNKLQDDAQIKLSKSRQELESVDTKIAQAKDRITHSKEKLQDKSLLAPEKKTLGEQIKHDEADFKAAQVRRAELDKSITAQEKQYTEASKISDRVSEAIEGRTAKASREVQMFRAFLDMTDSLASTFQNISKIITATEFDYKAAQKKIESEMAAFMVNFFQSNLQNVKNSASQVSDGMNSVKSSCDASLQIFDDSVKLAVRS